MYNFINMTRIAGIDSMMFHTSFRHDGFQFFPNLNSLTGTGSGIDNEIMQPVYSLLPYENIRCDSFFLQADWEGKFDVVIGNPPFVRIHNIIPEVKEQFFQIR